MADILGALIAVGVILGILLIIYSRVKGTNIGETLSEIKDLLIQQPE